MAAEKRKLLTYSLSHRHTTRHYRLWCYRTWCQVAKVVVLDQAGRAVVSRPAKELITGVHQRLKHAWLGVVGFYCLVYGFNRQEGFGSGSVGFKFACNCACGLGAWLC